MILDREEQVVRVAGVAEVAPDIEDGIRGKDMLVGRHFLERCGSRITLLSASAGNATDTRQRRGEEVWWGVRPESRSDKVSDERAVPRIPALVNKIPRTVRRVDTWDRPSPVAR